MRTLRNVLNVVLPLMGMVIVFSTILAVDDASLQVVLVVLGVLMIQSTAWKLTNPFFPSERRYPELRQETDRFVGLVRKLNTLALLAKASANPIDWKECEEVLASMHTSVETMGTLAGKELEEPPTRIPVVEAPAPRTISPI